MPPAFDLRGVLSLTGPGLPAPLIYSALRTQLLEQTQAAVFSLRGAAIPLLAVLLAGRARCGRAGRAEDLLAVNFFLAVLA